MAEKGYTYEESRPAETGKYLLIGGLVLGYAAVITGLVVLAVVLAKNPLPLGTNP
jgi:hypothetical protein